MTWPLAWLDVLVGVVVCASVGMALGTCWVDPSPLRGNLKAGSTAAFGLALMLGSLDELWTRQRAERWTDTGQVQVIRRTGGKSPRTEFTLLIPYGNYAGLHASTSSAGLVSGVHARVEWMLFNGDVLRYRLLDGPHAGETFQDVIPFEAFLSAVGGCCFFWTAFAGRRRDPMGHPSRRDTQPPLDGVDTRSLLNLNRR